MDQKLKEKHETNVVTFKNFHFDQIDKVCEGIKLDDRKYYLD